MKSICNTGILLAKSGYQSNYYIGIRAEKIIERIYKKNGWNVLQSPGSRGAADLICTKNDVSHYVQCKSSTVTNNPEISNEEIGRLKSTATKNNATAIIAKIGANGKKEIIYAKTKNDAKI